MKNFLNDLNNDGGWGNEAIEIGLQYANKEIKKKKEQEKKTPEAGV